MRKAALVAFGLLSLAGCGSGAPSSGYVVERRFVAAHWEDGYVTEYRPELRCRSVYVPGYGSQPGRSEQRCETEMVPWQRYEPHYRYEQDAYQLRLEECKERKGANCRRGWVTVAPSDYDRFSVGEYYGEK